MSELPYYIPPDRAQVVAEVHNQKIADTMPLFAATGQLDTVVGAELWSAEALVEKWNQHNQAMDALYSTLRKQAAARRAAVAELVTPERLAQLEEYCGKQSLRIEYAASYWLRQLTELAPDHPLVQHPSWTGEEQP